MVAVAVDTGWGEEVGETVQELQGEGWSSAVTDQTLEAGPVRGLDSDAGVEAKPTTVVPGKHVFGVVGLQEALAASRAAYSSVARSAPSRGSARPSSDAKLSSKNVTKDPLAHSVLETLQELGRETGGFVEVEATGVGFGSLVRIENAIRFSSWW